MKQTIKKFTPDLILDFIKIKKRYRQQKKQSAKDIFTTYKETKFWKSTESLSGDGSELAVTLELRKGLDALIKSFSITSILDIPCGDFNWMKEVDLQHVNYIGGDIVASLVVSNTEQYASKHITFKELDIITNSLPKVDLIICRDCLVHLSYKDIYKALQNIKKSESDYLLLTSFVNSETNKDILTGEWRKLNFEKYPFNFGKPQLIIDEKYTEKDLKYVDKSMCLWRVEDIKLPLKLKIYSWFF